MNHETSRTLHPKSARTLQVNSIVFAGGCRTYSPRLQLLYKWKIPFYYLNGKPFCYFNASHKKQFVDVAFMMGFHLDIHQDVLVDEGRSLVKSLRYVSLETIDNEILVDVLIASKELYP